MTLGVICFFILEKKMQIFFLCQLPLPLKPWRTGAKCVFFIILAFLQTKIEYLSFCLPPTIIITKMFLYYLQRNKSFAPVFKFLPTKNLERFVSCEPKDYKWKGPLKNCCVCLARRKKRNKSFSFEPDYCFVVWVWASLYSFKVRMNICVGKSSLSQDKRYQANQIN